MDDIAFIFAVCTRLSLKASIPTTCIYFHKAISHVRDHDSKYICMGCVSLASKMEEESRPMRDIVNCSYAVLHPDSPVAPPSDVSREKSRIYEAELLVLRALGFQVKVEHPHRFIMQFVRALSHSDTNNAYKLVHVACALANDTLYTPMCIDHESALLGAACIKAAMKLLGKDVFVPDWEKIAGISKADSDDLSRILVEEIK